jgi:hypothetical protein
MKITQMGIVFKCLKKLNKVKITAYSKTLQYGNNQKDKSNSEMK